MQHPGAGSGRCSLDNTHSLKRSIDISVGDCSGDSPGEPDVAQLRPCRTSGLGFWKEPGNEISDHVCLVVLLYSSFYYIVGFTK